MHYHHGFGIAGFIGSLLMIIMMTLPLILVIWLSFYLFDKVNKDKSSGNINTNSSTPEIRLAKGKLSIDEYRQIKNKTEKQPSGS